MERVVLTSPLGGPSETVVHDETGWHVPAGDAGRWAQAVDMALARLPDVGWPMGRAARFRVERDYSLRAMAAATFTVYRRALEARR